MKICNDCGSELVPGVNWFPSWVKNYTYLCKECFYERRNTHTVIFKGKRVYVSENVRVLRRKCKLCPNMVNIVLHHNSYDKKNPLEDTEPLCRSCHKKEKHKDIKKPVKSMKNAPDPRKLH